jgi:hypothetical protein
MNGKFKKDLPEGGYFWACPFDEKKCDEFRFQTSQENPKTAMCRHDRWNPNTEQAPCERLIEDRKRKKNKQKIKRKIKKCKCK